MLRIALAQTPCKLGDKSENISRMESMVSSADSDVYIFAELFLTGYMIRDDVYRLAERTDGKSIDKIARICKEHGCSIGLGMPVMDDEIPGLVRNSFVMVSPDGKVERYDKMNLANFGPFEEGFYFTPGELPSIFQVNGHRIGAVICYDLFFPELVKSYAAAGAEAIVCISASPVTSRYFFEKIVVTRAIEDTSYIVYVNQAGCQLNQVFFGGSEAVDPLGAVIAKNKYFQKDLNVIEVSDDILRTARRSRPTIRDSIPL